MPLDDAFVHAWVTPADIAPARWEPMRDDIISVLRAASRELERDRSDDALAVLRGPEGFGPLHLAPDAVAFNGNAFLGFAGDPFAIERKPRRGVLARASHGGARRAVRRCRTEGHPYDLAVCAVLLVVLRHLGDEARVGTSGGLRTGWGRAAALVRATIGECGQLVQHENGALRWVDAPAAGGQVRSSAS
ncbi:MAG TPA: hypothetical protein VMH39_06700 [Gemmatimonadaceae bacterium]|nr:hypothetical protein [Gemmatimonadaceae bacterium]